MKILICDKTEKEYIEQMRAAGLTVDVRDDITPEELPNVLPAYDGMVVRSRTKVRQPLIDVCPNLKVIVRGGVGPRHHRPRICQVQGHRGHEHPACQFCFRGGTRHRLYVHAGPLALQSHSHDESRKMGQESPSQARRSAARRSVLIGCGQYWQRNCHARHCARHEGHCL